MLATRQNNKPSRVLLVLNGERYEFELWCKGAGKSLLEINNSIKHLSALISSFFNPLVFCDLKWFLDSVSAPPLHNKVDHYDLLIDPIQSTFDPRTDGIILNAIADKLLNTQIKPWMSYVANAQHAYREIEKTGLNWNHTPVQPKWDYYTYSGRSRCTGFNAQGHSSKDILIRNGIPTESFLLHFDWSCADLRMLGLLSGDDVLLSTFEDSDPYTVVSKVLEIDRSEAKSIVLRKIYSLDLDDLLYSMFPKACDWLKSITFNAESNSYTRNPFGRVFQVSGDRTVRSAVNAVLQGSIATLAQIMVHKAHQMFPMYLVTDTFDGVVLSVPNDQVVISNAITSISAMMKDPFGDASYMMSSSTSIGTRWGNWEKINI